jgi:hypothetical protein
MKAIQHTLKLLFFASFLLISGMLLGQQSIIGFYIDGIIPTGYNGGNWDPGCNGSTTSIQLQLPPGVTYEVTGIDINYTMTSVSGYPIMDQRSQIHCLNTGMTESTISGTTAGSGSEEYIRTGVNIANGIYNGNDILTFEMRAWRNSEGIPGCNNSSTSVDDFSWFIIVYFKSPKVGINTPSPQATLDVAGEIRIGNSENPVVEGTIRYDNNDFMGYDGTEWSSLLPKGVQELDRLGVNTSSPESTLDVQGVIKMGDDPSIYSAPNQPQPGMIRWDAQTQDFVGYDGTEWSSLLPKGVQELDRLGVNTSSPESTLDVQGVIKVGDDPSIYSAPNQPQQGMIRWDSQNQDFVGYDGSEWKSLTQKKTQEIYIPGVAFFPKNANSDYSFLETSPASGDYHYLGRSSSVVLIYPISLPVGSVINSVTFFYLDRYTNVDITFSINSNSYNSSIENTIWQANSTGDSPTIRSISAFPNNYVSTSYFYYLQALYTQTVNTKFLGIKGVRINYTLP